MAAASNYSPVNNLEATHGDSWTGSENASPYKNNSLENEWQESQEATPSHSETIPKAAAVKNPGLDGLEAKVDDWDAWGTNDAGDLPDSKPQSSEATKPIDAWEDF
jgi:hypothetical protein